MYVKLSTCWGLWLDIYLKISSLQITVISAARRSEFQDAIIGVGDAIFIKYFVAGAPEHIFGLLIG